MGQSRWVHVTVNEIKAATDKAVLAEIDGEQVWIPRSQISEGEKYERGDAGVTLSVTEFIAEKLGLEGEE